MTTEHHPDFFLEAHFIYGLERIAYDELRHHLKRQFVPMGDRRPDHICFQYIHNLRNLKHLRTITAFYLGSIYRIPRPKALLGHAHFQHLIKQINQVIKSSQSEPFHSFRIEAAGSDSAVFRRLRQQIVQSTQLINDQKTGDLLIRILPAQDQNHVGWKILCRLTPRPLSVRAWRTVDFPGSLNATVAAATILMSEPQSTDRVLNLMCGSGTFLIERLLIARAKSVVGCDLDGNAIHAAKTNIHSAGLSSQIELLQEDATSLPFPRNSFDVIIADLPWGHLVGGHAQNQILYPSFIEETARIAADGAKLLIITTEIGLMERMLKEYNHLWQLREVIRLKLKDTHPRIYLLVKR